MLDKHKNHGIPMPYLRNVNVRWGIFDLSELLQMRFEPSETERYSIKTGDLVVCEGGEPGRCAVWTNGLKDIRIQKALHRVRPYNGISSLLLSYIFRRYAQIQYIDKFFTGSTIKHLTGEALNQLLIILPPVAEQQRIVSQIKALLKYVDEIDRESETLEKFITLAKQKILDLAIRGKLVPQDPTDEPASELLKKIKAEKEALVKAGKIKKDKHESFIFKGDDNCYYEQLNGKTVDITTEIPFGLPESWHWCRLRSLGQIVGGGTPSTANQMFWNGSIPWLSPADLTGYTGMYITHGKKNITEEGLEKSSAVLMPAGSVLYSSRAPIGYVIISKNSISTNQGFKSLVPAIVGMSEFYYFALKARTADIKQRATGTTFKEISGNEFGDTIVPLPPIAEQQRIVQAIMQYNSILEAISE